MKTRRLSLLLASFPCLSLSACGDDGATTSSGTADGTADDSGTAGTSAGTSTATTAGTSTSASNTDTGTASDATQGGTATDTGTGSASLDSGSGDSGSATQGTGTDASGSSGGATDGATDGSTTSGVVGTTSGESSGGGGTEGACNGGGGNQFEFSYIWIANSPQGTVSKIDTATAVEEGRYYTGPLGDRDPSRTSVSGNGRYAAVANREGGLTVIAAEDEDCIDADNDMTIDTSTGPADILAWNSDECVLWNIALPGTGSQGPRPISWTIGEQDPVTCEYATGDIWIGWYDLAANTGTFRLVEGLTGNMIDEVDVPNWSGQNWGPYGGAIDSQNNFWAIGWGQSGPVVKIDGVTHQATNFGNPGGWIYGMGLDLQGNTYASGCGNGNVYRFNATTETWSMVATVPNASCLRGLQVDLDGVAWIARNGGCGLAAIDTTVEPPAAIDLAIPLAGCVTPVGVSIDAEGYVWVVDQSGTAFKVDPDNYQVVDTVAGLVSPYTYSDMTGAGINAQITPQ